MRSGYLGLQLTAGALALIGATWLFGGVAEDVVHGDPLILFDVGFRAGRSHTWVTGIGFMPNSDASKPFSYSAVTVSQHDKRQQQIYRLTVLQALG